ncbi:MAG: DUF86 domain-containing protein [Candidatus Methanomethylophilaceae archaeon]|nr:DUF86 domain-containing protein [Candidatus Methanomethylophilaceae archaeon]
MLDVEVFGSDEEDFISNTAYQISTAFSIQYMGGCAKGLSAELRERHPEVGWREMIRMRDFIAHNYGNVDLSIQWDTVKNDIPALKNALMKIESLPSSDGWNP